MAIDGGLTHMSAKRNGFSLIEVMVSLVILTVGLIGIFNLHIMSKQGSFESFQQTQASYYANDIVNRMRLNRSQLANYVGTYSGTPTAAALACEGANICSPAQLVDWDIYEWQSAFTGEAEKVGTTNVGGLSDVTSCIELATDTVTVTMSWRSLRETSDSGDATSCGTGSNKRRLFTIETVII